MTLESGAGSIARANGSTATRLPRRSAMNGRRETIHRERVRELARDAGVVPGNVIAYRHADPRFPFLREDCVAIRRPVERARRTDPLLLRHAGRRLGGVHSPRGDPRPAGPLHHSPRALGRRHRRDSVSSAGSAEADTDGRNRTLGRHASKSLNGIGTTRGRHHRAFGSVETGRGTRMACRRGPPSPAPTGTGRYSCCLADAPKLHRLGCDRRWSPEPGPAPQSSAFPTERIRPLIAP